MARRGRSRGSHGARGNEAEQPLERLFGIMAQRGAEAYGRQQRIRMAALKEVDILGHLAIHGAGIWAGEYGWQQHPIEKSLFATTVFDIALQVVHGRKNSALHKLEAAEGLFREAVACRVGRTAWGMLQQLPAPPVPTGEWLWDEVGRRTWILNVEGACGPEAIVLMRRRKEDRDREGANNPGYKAAMLRLQGREGLEIEVLAAPDIDQTGVPEGGGALCGAINGGRTARREVEVRERCELRRLLEVGTISNAVNACWSAIDGREAGLARMEAGPAHGSGKGSRAKIRRAIAETVRGGRMMSQWILPGAEREERGGSTGATQSQGEGGGAGSGRAKAAAHGVGGHWRRQTYGAGGSQRKWIHIGPYWRGVKGIEGSTIEWVIPEWTDQGRPK